MIELILVSLVDIIELGFVIPKLLKDNNIFSMIMNIIIISWLCKMNYDYLLGRNFNMNPYMNGMLLVSTIFLISVVIADIML